MSRRLKFSYKRQVFVSFWLQLTLTLTARQSRTNDDYFGLEERVEPWQGYLCVLGRPSPFRSAWIG